MGAKSEPLIMSKTKNALECGKQITAPQKKNHDMSQKTKVRGLTTWLSYESKRGKKYCNGKIHLSQRNVASGGGTCNWCLLCGLTSIRINEILHCLKTCSPQTMQNIIFTQTISLTRHPMEFTDAGSKLKKNRHGQGTQAAHQKHFMFYHCSNASRPLSPSKMVSRYIIGPIVFNPCSETYICQIQHMMLQNHLPSTYTLMGSDCPQSKEKIMLSWRFFIDCHGKIPQSRDSAPKLFSIIYLLGIFKNIDFYIASPIFSRSFLPLANCLFP